jgi:hypothetical protein
MLPRLNQRLLLVVVADHAPRHALAYISAAHQNCSSTLPADNDAVGAAHVHIHTAAWQGLPVSAGTASRPEPLQRPQP